jgi:pilus assembly protein Flp/PilA
VGTSNRKLSDIWSGLGFASGHIVELPNSSGTGEAVPRLRPLMASTAGTRYDVTPSRFSKDQTAATAIEYSLIAGGIALAIVGVVQALGTQVKVPFTTMSGALK